MAVPRIANPPAPAAPAAPKPHPAAAPAPAFVPVAPRPQSASGSSSTQSSGPRSRAAASSGDEANPGMSFMGEGLRIDIGERRGGQGGAEGDGEESGAEGANEKRVAAVADASFNLDALADQIAPEGVDDGIFEVIMPDGQKMGVVVKLQDEQARFHLSPADAKLGEQLRQRKMELQGRLERRMHRKVEVTVL